MKKGPTGPQKVAAFLLSLEKDASVRIMRNLDPKVVADVAEAMTELDPGLCTAEAIESLFEDLSRTVFARSGVRPRDDFELYEILESTYGDEEAGRVINDIHERRRQEQPFGFLEKVNPASASRILSEESPAVVALVLSHVSPTVSAEVLSSFEPEEALEIVKRMTSIVPPAIETMLEIADGLIERLKLFSSGPVPREREESLRSVADLLNYAEGETGKHVLEGLEEEDDDTANEIREFMFTWEDLSTVDKRSMQKILTSVDTRTLSISLKGSSPDVEENVMKNLSKRVREMVLDERELAGALPLSEVVESRKGIMRAVRNMMDSGEFSPTRAGEDLVT